MPSVQGNGIYFALMQQRARPTSPVDGSPLRSISFLSAASGFDVSASRMPVDQMWLDHSPQPIVRAI